MIFAGIAIATVIYSAITGEKIDNHIAMTGEIGLLGSVRPIGGVKAKIMGAKKAGVKKVLIPKENFSDTLLEISDIEISVVETINEVFKIVFSSKDDNKANTVKIEEDEIDILSASSNDNKSVY